MELITISPQEINEGERARKDYGGIEELKSSILDHGLIHPIACVRDNDKLTLLAGGRRLRACKELHKADKIGEIPVRVYEALSHDERMIIELVENIQRKDLTWRERVDLEKRIHEAHVKLHGVKRKFLGEQKGWGQKDTADLMGHDRTATNKLIKLAEAVEKDPEKFKDCKDQNDALKRLKNIQKQNLIKVAAAVTKDRPSQIHRNYMIGNTLHEIAKLPDKVVDFIDLDPPYGIQLDDQGKKANSAGVSEYHEIKASGYKEFLEFIFAQCFRVLREESWMIAWYAIDPWHQSVIDAAEKAGFIVCKKPCVWVKSSGQCQQPETRMASAWEPFLYMRKGKAKLIQQGKLDIFHNKPIPPGQKIHPTEKPIDLMTDILNRFCYPNADILVPFLGGASTLIAAEKLGMKAFGWDLSPEYRDAAIVKSQNCRV